MDFLSEFEAPISPHFLSHATPLNHPANGSLFGGDVEMEAANDEDVVQWQSSQTSSALESLLGKGSFHSRASASSLSSSSSSAAKARSSMGTESYRSFESGLSSVSSTSASTSTSRRRPSALASSSRKNISSASTSTSSNTKANELDNTETFSLFVQQITSQVDENLAHNAGVNGNGSKSGLTRTTSRGNLFARQASRKPVSANGIVASKRQPGQGRVLERTVSANAVVGRDREHRVGGDVKGKGKLRDESVFCTTDGGRLLGGGGAHDGILGRSGEESRTYPPDRVGAGGGVVRRDLCAMPPPALPPERVVDRAQQQRHEHTHRGNPCSVGPTVVGEKPTQAEYATSRKNLEPVPVRNASNPASPPHAPPALVKKEITTVTPNVGNAAAPAPILNAYQRQYQRPNNHNAPPPQPPAPPRPPQAQHAPASSQINAGVARGPPPALGMRRAKTFSSSGSQKAYAPFGFGSQNLQGEVRGNGTGSHSGVNGNGSGGGGIGLPVKQRGFKPPLKAGPVKGAVTVIGAGGRSEQEQARESPGAGSFTSSSASTSSYSSSSRGASLSASASSLASSYSSSDSTSRRGSASTHFAGSAKGQVPANGGSIYRQAPFKRPSPEAPQKKGVPLVLTSDSSSSTMGSSPAAQAPSKAAGDGVEQDEFDMLLEDDPNDSSYGDIDIPFDLDALEDACRMYD